MKPSTINFANKRTLVGHTQGVLCCAFSATGSYVLSGSLDRTIALWNSESGKRVATFDGHGQSVRDVQCSNDSATVISVSADKHLLCWDVAKQSVARKVRAHDAEINAVRFCPNNAVCVTGGADRKIHVWDMRSRSHAPMQTMAQHKDAVSSIAVSNYEIMSSSLDGTVRQFDLRAGKLRVDTVTNTSAMNVCYTNDSNCILVATLESKLRLLDKLNGELLNTFEGHKNVQFKTQATLSKDDAWVISGSEDNAIYIWDLVDASIQQTLRGHSHVVTSLAYSPATNSFVSGSIDRTLIIWSL